MPIILKLGFKKKLWQYFVHAYKSHETMPGYCSNLETALTHNKMSLAKPKSPSFATLFGPKFVNRQLRAATSLQSEKKKCVYQLKKNLT